MPRAARSLLLAAALALPWAGARAFDPDAMERFAVRLFERIDLDGDGVITPAEHAHTRGGGFMVDFGLLDLDGDGQVTRAEYLVAVRRYHPPGGGRPI